MLKRQPELIMNGLKRVCEDGALVLSGQRVLPPVSATQAARGVRSDGQQIVVT